VNRKTKLIIIDKYFLYAILMCIIARPVAVDIWQACTLKKTNGIVESSYLIQNPHLKGRGYRDYPIIRFETDSYSISFTSTKELIGVAKYGDSVPVLYSPKENTEAYVYNFSGYWIRHLGYIIPLVLVITLLFCSDVIRRKWFVRL